MSEIIKILEQGNNVIHSDKTGIAKDEVRTSLDSSVKDTLIKSSTYTEQAITYNRHNSLEQGNNVIHSDKTGIAKDEVRTSLDSSVKDTLIKPSSYTGQTLTNDRHNSQHEGYSTRKPYTNLEQSGQKIILENRNTAQIIKQSDDTVNNVIKTDKTGIAKDEVRTSLDSSVKDTLIKPSSYTGQTLTNDRHNSQHEGYSTRKPYTNLEQSGQKIILENRNTAQIIKQSDDTINSIIKTDKTGIAKDEVRTSLESSVKDTIIKSSNYTGKRTVQEQAKLKSQKGVNPTKQSHATAGQKNKENEAEKSPIEQIINKDKSDIGKDFVNQKLDDKIKTMLTDKKKKTESKIKEDPNKTGIEEEGSRKKSLLKTAGNSIYRGIDRATGNTGGNDLTERAAKQTIKHGLRASKNTIVAGAIAFRGVYKYGKYSVKALNDYKSAILTGKEASLAILKRGGVSLNGSGKSVINFVKNEVIKNIKDFHGSDDLGVQALTKPKDIYVRTRQVFKVLNTSRKATTRTIRAIKNATVKSVRFANKTYVQTKQALKLVYGVVKKVVTNPVVLKGAAVAGGGLISIILTLLPVIVVVALIPTFSLKSEDYELSKTYSYITEKDARMQEEIVRACNDRSIDYFHYYLNGYSASRNSLEVYTNAELMLMYFDSKYDDYLLDKILLFFGGTSVRNEIDKIHEILHQFTTSIWEEERTYHETTHYEDGTSSSYTWTVTYYHMDIYLDTVTFDDYLDDNRDTLLTREEQQKFEAVNTVGVYTFRQELGSPFVGVKWHEYIDWSENIPSRYGWHIHPRKQELKKHEGIDINIAEGTPINAVMSGTVTEAYYDENGYGNYVTIKNSEDNTTTYAHMSGVAVTIGQEVLKGDFIGNTGSTGGEGNGNTLHIEYKKKGNKLNPIFYLFSD